MTKAVRIPVLVAPAVEAVVTSGVEKAASMDDDDDDVRIRSRKIHRNQISLN